MGSQEVTLRAVFWNLDDLQIGKEAQSIHQDGEDALVFFERLVHLILAELTHAAARAG